MARKALTNRIKSQIIDNALVKAGIPERKDALCAARAAWAERVRLAAIGGPAAEAQMLKNLKKIEALVSEFPGVLKPLDRYAREAEYMDINMAGARVRVYFNGNYWGGEGRAPEDIVKITPSWFTLQANDPLVTEFYGFDACSKRIKSDESDIRLNVRAALDKVSTVNRLLEGWPEAKELLPADASAVTLLPAIRRETLNEMIGLPSDEGTRAPILQARGGENDPAFS